MTIEIMVLALVCAVRPTSLAALYSLLSTAAPRRLVTVYVLAGLAFTVSFGALVIVAFGGVDVDGGTSRTKAIADIAGGTAALAFGLGVLLGRIGGAEPTDAPKTSNRFTALLKRELTPRTSAIAGAATHIPGLFYLIALNVIVAHHAHFPARAFELAVYNAIWFALPLTALVLCIVAPDVARGLIAGIEAWTKRHARAIVLTASFGIGAALVVRGVLSL